MDNSARTLLGGARGRKSAWRVSSDAPENFPESPNLRPALAPNQAVTQTAIFAPDPFSVPQASEPAPPVLSPRPIRRLPNWNQRVDAALSAKELAEVRTCVERGRPFGDPAWVEDVADRHSLWYTLRPPGRPRKAKTPKSIVREQ